MEGNFSYRKSFIKKVKKTNSTSPKSGCLGTKEVMQYTSVMAFIGISIAVVCW